MTVEITEPTIPPKQEEKTVQNQEPQTQQQKLQAIAPITECTLADAINKVVLVTIIKPGSVETPAGQVVYTEQVLRDSLPLWDGAACFCDHFNKSVRNIAGVYFAPYYEDGVKAKLRFIDESLHKLVCQIIQDREQKLPVPDIGISADITVDCARQDHTFKIKTIAQVISADIVFSPAAGGSFDRVLNAAGISPLSPSPLAGEGKGEVQNQPDPGSPKAVTVTRKTDTDTVSAEELVPVSRVRDLQSANDKLRAQLKDKETINLKLQGEVLSAAKELGQAVKKYRESLIKANPAIPEELLKGESIPDLDASLGQAQAIVEKIKANLEGEAVIPAGSPSRKGPDISELSPTDKIKYGLQHK